MSISDNQNKVLRYFTLRRIILPIIIGLAVSVWLILRDIGEKEISIDIAFESFYWFLAALILQGIRDFAYMVRLRLLTGGEISWRNSFQAIVLWEFANSVTPSFIGGSAIALFIVHREGINMGRSTAVVMITAMLDELFHILVIPIVFLTTGYHSHFIQLDNLPFDLGTKGVFYVGYFFILILITTLITGIFITPKGFKKLLVFIFRLPILRKWSKYASRTGDEIIVTSGIMRRKSLLFWLKAFGITAIAWSARFLVVNALIGGFNPVKDHLFLFGRQAVMWVILMISPTPGSSGVAEYFFPQFLGIFIQNDMSDIIAFLWRFISYYPYLIIGSLILPFWFRRVMKKKKIN